MLNINSIFNHYTTKNNNSIVVALKHKKGKILTFTPFNIEISVIPHCLQFFQESPKLVFLMQTFYHSTTKNCRHADY